MTNVERLILENQKIILHGLRALCWNHGLNSVAEAVQDAQFHTHDALRDAPRAKR